MFCRIVNKICGFLVFVLLLYIGRILDFLEVFVGPINIMAFHDVPLHAARQTNNLMKWYWWFYMEHLRVICNGESMKWPIKLQHANIELQEHPQFSMVIMVYHGYQIRLAIIFGLRQLHPAANGDVQFDRNSNQNHLFCYLIRFKPGSLGRKSLIRGGRVSNRQLWCKTTWKFGIFWIGPLTSFPILIEVGSTIYIL